MKFHYHIKTDTLAAVFPIISFLNDSKDVEQIFSAYQSAKKNEVLANSQLAPLFKAFGYDPEQEKKNRVAEKRRLVGNIIQSFRDNSDLEEELLEEFNCLSSSIDSEKQFLNFLTVYLNHLRPLAFGSSVTMDTQKLRFTSTVMSYLRNLREKNPGLTASLRQHLCEKETMAPIAEIIKKGIPTDSNVWKLFDLILQNTFEIPVETLRMLIEQGVQFAYDNIADLRSSLEATEHKMAELEEAEKEQDAKKDRAIQDMLNAFEKHEKIVTQNATQDFCAIFLGLFEGWLTTQTEGQDVIKSLIQHRIKENETQDKAPSGTSSNVGMFATPRTIPITPTNTPTKPGPEIIQPSFSDEEIAKILGL